MLQAFLLCLKKTAHKPSKVAIAKASYPVSMLLLQLASKNVLYSMWYLEDIAFLLDF